MHNTYPNIGTLYTSLVAFDAQQRALRDDILRFIKDIIRELSPDAETVEFEEEVYMELGMERPAKYWTPCDYPGNFVFTGFGIAGSTGELMARGNEISDESEYTFFESDFSFDELRTVLEALTTFSSNVKSGRLSVDVNGLVNLAEAA